MKMPIEPKAEIGGGILQSSASFAAFVFSRPHLCAVTWAVLTAVVTALYLLPDASPPGRADADKIAHLLAFGSLGFLGLLASTRPGTGTSPGTKVPLLMNPLLAIGLEWLQSFVPGREYSVGDWSANLAGLFLGIGIAVAIRFLVWRRLGSSI